MAIHVNSLRSATRARRHRNHLHRFDRIETLEKRVLLAAPPVLQPPAGLTFLDPASVAQFVNDITAINPFVPGFQYTPDNVAGNHFTVGAYPITQDLGLGINPATNLPYQTPLFGFGPDAANATYPGRTFSVQRDQPIAVTWVNGLPARHIIPIDPTLLDESMVYNAMTNEIAGGTPFVPHLHGGHTDAIYDGTPLQWWNSTSTGEDYTDTQLYNPTQPAHTFTYRNDQDSATNWYHDHAMGVTRLNAYAGMAGFYLIRDAYDTGLSNNPLGLPAGAYEMGLAVQDKQFLSDGQMWFPAEAQTFDGVDNVASAMPEMFGDTILVNGKAWPKMDVEARRYRFRLVNASDSRFYTLKVSPTTPNGNTSNNKGNVIKTKGKSLPIWQIGTDVGLMNQAVSLNQITIGPGERADFIIDFTGINPGTRFVLSNNAKTPFPGGSPIESGLTDRVMAFDVIAATGIDTSTPPALLTNLRPDAPIPMPPSTVPAADRALALYETEDAMGRVTPLLGTPETSATFMDPITENISIGATEVWEIFNNTADSHPIHLHLVKFQVLSRQKFNSKLVELEEVEGITMVGMGPVTLKGSPSVPSASGNEIAWKDTVQIHPGEVVKIRATFDTEGKYVWHCHILSHEEHDMMRFFQVGTNPFPEPAVVVDSSGAVITSLQAAGLVTSTFDVHHGLFSPIVITMRTGDDSETLLDQLLA